MRSSPLAVVSGSAGAIGGAIAQRLRAAGWRVIGLDSQAGADDSGLLENLQADVADAGTWARVADAVADHGGELHGLVHCAAYQVCAPLVDTGDDDWQRTMDVNLGAFYLGCRALHSALRATGGSVLGIGSVHARATSANIAAYAASKGGLSALVRALAIEWAPDGIRVNAVLPGAVDSQMLRDGLRRGHLAGDEDEKLLAGLARRTVMGRIGAPRDIAEAALFMLDPERAGFITGSELVADGGACARLSTE